MKGPAKLVAREEAGKAVRLPVRFSITLAAAERIVAALARNGRPDEADCRVVGRYCSAALDAIALSHFVDRQFDGDGKLDARERAQLLSQIARRHYHSLAPTVAAGMIAQRWRTRAEECPDGLLSEAIPHSIEYDLDRLTRGGLRPLRHRQIYHDIKAAREGN